VASFPEGGIFGVGFFKDGEQQVLPLDPAPRVVDVGQTPQALTVRGGKNFSPSSVAFSRDSRLLAIGSDDTTVRVVEAATGRLLWSAVHDPDQGVRQVAFSPDGRLLASCGGDSVKLWDVKKGNEVRVLEGHIGRVGGLAFSPDGRLLASAAGIQGRKGAAGEVKVWDVASGKEMRSFADDTSQFFSVAFSPDGARLAAETDGAIWARAGDQRQAVKIRVWDLTSEKVFELPSTARGRDGVAGVLFSPDGKRIAWNPGDGNVVISDAKTGQELLKFPGQRAAFSPDGRRLVTTRSGGPGVLRLWSDRGEEVLDLRGHRGVVVAAAFSPDGGRLASADMTDRTVRIWDGTPEGEGPAPVRP
jgi:WD40 repeat protein